MPHFTISALGKLLELLEVPGSGSWYGVPYSGRESLGIGFAESIRKDYMNSILN